MRKAIFGDREFRRRLFSLVFPIALQQLMLAVVSASDALMLNWISQEQMAAVSLATQVTFVENLFLAAMTIGLSMLAAQYWGKGDVAGHLDTAREYGGRLCVLSIISGAASGALLLALRPLILSLAHLSETATGYLSGMLFVCAYYMVGKAVNGTTIAGIFCAGGDSRFGLICDAITMWGVTVPLGLLAAFVFRWPILVVYFIVSLDELVKLPAVYRHYKQYKWVKDLTIKEELS